MECGIFAIIGVIVGVIIEKGGLRLNIPKRKKQLTKENEPERLTVSKQWENLLNYNGKGK